ncbi:protein of unknown function-containing protein [Forsythia ovata]|uniref:DUF632 domain-containing protein n=1 Tax=Forsythia ovata TaxID=205694 RepID=A0ABD1SMM7_9LAMI
MKRADYVKTEKAKKGVEKLESHILVASQAIETTSAEIIKLRESKLYPQLVELVQGLVISLFSCQLLIPANSFFNMSIVKRCIDVIASKVASSDLSLFGWPVDE